MWYFAWILGTGFACSVTIMAGIWYEFKSTPGEAKNITPPLS